MPDNNLTRSAPKPITTDKQLAALKPADKEYERRVADCPGLRVRVSPKGKIVFMHRYISPATRRTVKISLGVYLKPRAGSGPLGMSLSEARTLWFQNHSLILRKLDPKLETEKLAGEREQEARRRAARAEHTVATLVDAYARHASNTQRSWQSTVRVLRRDFVEPLGDISAHDVTQDDIKGLINAIRAEGKPASAIKLLAHIKSCYNWAIETGWPVGFPINVNPALGIKIRKLDPRTRHLNDAEMRKLITVIPERLKPQFSDFLLFLAATGVRISEAASMKWSNVFDGVEWRIDQTKNDKPHVVFLSDYARNILERQPERSEYVWHSNNTHTGYISAQATASYLAYHIPDIGVDKFVAHDLRRTLSSWLGREGASRDIRDRMLNHIRGNDIDSVYTVVSNDKPAREWWQRYGEHLARLAGPRMVWNKDSA